MTTTTITPWFGAPERQDDPRPVLICLPYAGGGATVFRAWDALFAEHAEVAPVRLPGREHRIGDPPGFDLSELADAVVDRVGQREFALFGHSMGGRIAFELAGLLHQRGVEPGLVVTSATRPPHVLADGPLDRVSGLSDARLVSRLRRAGSVPEEILDEPELVELFLPALRADFAWLESRALTPGTAIDTPLLALAGSFDRVATIDQVSGWSRWTQGECREVILAGDHFFVNTQAELIRDEVVSAWDDLAVRRRPQPPADGCGRAEMSGAAHHVTIGDGPAWADALVRTAMLPADELDRLVDQVAADAADAALAAPGDRAARDRVHDLLTQPVPGLHELAGHPLVREALAWQNPAVLEMVAPLQEPGGRVSRRSRREAVLARYWQRYAAKNETIGFFGPTTWGRLAPGTAHTTVTWGDRVLSRRETRLEGWAVRAIADRIVGSREARRIQVPRCSPLFEVDLPGRAAHRLPRPPLALTEDLAAVLAQVDGARTGAQVALAADIPIERAEAALDEATHLQLLQWPGQVAPGHRAQADLEEVLAGLPQGPVGDRARRQWSQVLAGVGDLDTAAGDADAVRAAGERLERIVGRLSGVGTSRSPGQMYAGRRVFFEDTAADVDVVVGDDILAPLGEVLGPLRRMARWLCAELGLRYQQAFEELCERLDDGSGEIGLEELFLVAQPLLFGPSATIPGAVADEFARRWSAVLDLPDAAADVITLEPAQFDSRVRAHFPDRSNPWRSARIHSPDVQVLAPDLAAVNAGLARFVVGELHAGWATLDVAALLRFHPDPDGVRRAHELDTGGHRVRLALPPTWPRKSTRTVQTMLGDHDVHLNWVEDAGADPQRALTTRQMRVVRGHDGWRAAPRSWQPAAPTAEWPLVEVFADLLAIHAVDGFKLLAGAGASGPRVEVGRVTLTRRTWRSEVAQTGLIDASTRERRFLAGRRLRSRLDLPEQVYVSISTETKPVYCDFRSPLYVQGLATLLHSAHQRDENARVTISEALPTPQDAWFPDGRGGTCFSEIRVHLVEPEPTA